MASLLRRALPPSPLARRLSAQSILFAVGEGTFITGNAVFFTHIVGLSAAQVGLGLSISGLVIFALAVPLGRAADRVGSKRMWALCALLEALAYLLYPLIHGFAAFVAILVMLATVDAAGSAGRGAYTIGAFTHEERIRSLAFMRSALNIGFTLGALIGGLALATGSDRVIRGVPLLTAAILLVNAVLIARLPDIRLDAPMGEPKRVTSTALRNRGFLGLSICQGVLGTNQTLLNVVVPLWLVQETDAPHTLLAWLFGTNTVLAVLFQVPAARGSHTVPGTLRATRLCAMSFVVACLLIMYTHDTIGWTSIVLIWAAHVAITGAELFGSASSWGMLAELSDPDRRAEYQGAFRLGGQVSNILGPAAFTWLAMTWGMSGWLVIGTLAVVAAVLMHPAVRSAQRHLAATEAQQPA